MSNQIDEFTKRRISVYAVQFVDKYTENPPKGSPTEAGAWARKTLPPEFLEGEYLLELQKSVREELTARGWELQDTVVH